MITTPQQLEHDDNTTFDIVIIGAGPAGSATAAVLAEHGHSVLIVEKETFPRYRVGESLIPYCWFPLNRLGLIDKIDTSSFVVQKHSVQFVGTEGDVTTPFYFNRHSDHDSSRTWQVNREKFDQLLLDNAIEKGAQVRFNTTARDLITSNGQVVGIHVRDNDTKNVTPIKATITIDASGRDMFAVNKHQWKVADPKLKKIAIWNYFKGAKRDCGIDEGATTVAYLPEKGWFWYIPLPDDVVSVGVVAERDYLYRGKRDPEVILHREIDSQPWIKDHVGHAQPQPIYRVTGDYSYRSQHCARDGLLLVGDAFAFLDPVFSSGVFLALESGVRAGDAVHDALVNNDVSAAQFEAYGSHFRKGIEAMRRLVYAFYDTTFSFGDFLKQHPEHGRDLTDCLIGNVYKDLEPLFDAVAEFADIPAPLAHGQPLVSS